MPALRLWIKAAGFEKYFDVTVCGDEKIAGIIERNSAEIKENVLAEDISLCEAAGFVKDWNINGIDVKFGVEKL